MVKLREYDESNDERLQKAIEAYKIHGNLSASARNAGVSRRTIGYWLAKLKVFARDMADAREEYADNLEAQSISLMKDNTTKMPQAVLAMFHLKALRPTIYREKVDSGGIHNEIKIISSVPRPVAIVSSTPTQSRPLVKPIVPLELNPPQNDGIEEG